MGYFNKDWISRLIIDASPKGLGLIHTQYNPVKPDEKKIIEFNSRTLTEVESRYSQVELESLALVWSCEKRHYYVYNSDFEVVTDNKAVELIFGRSSSVQKGRIQRWGLRLRPYRFRVIHQPGSGNIADYLSRNPIGMANSQLADLAEDHLNMIASSQLPEKWKRADIAEASRNDPRLQNVVKMIKRKPHRKDEKFHRILDELAVTKDGLVLRSNRIVVPKALRKAIAKTAHAGHQGINKTKRLARKHVWFPGMDKMLEIVVKRCEKCMVNTKRERLNPIQTSEMPLGPWRQLALDHYGPFWGKYVLILIDLFSRYPLAKIVSSTSAKATVAYLEEIFSIFGIPKRLKSDNGPPFNSREFREFCESNGIIHDKVTPYWPRANGLVESFMKNVTKCLKNAQVNGDKFEDELREFLRSYRATPHSSTGVAPNELLFRAKPSTTRLPNALGEDQILTKARTNDRRAKDRMAKYANKKYKVKSHDFRIGDQVLMRQTLKGKAVTTYDKRPFIIKSINGTMIEIMRGGSIYARNASLLKRVPIQVRHRRTAIIEQTLDNPDEREALAENVENFNLEVQNDGQHPQSLRRSTRESRQPTRYGAGPLAMISEETGQ